MNKIFKSYSILYIKWVMTLIILIMSTSVFAKDVDHLSKIEGKKYLNQGKVGWCVPYALSGFISAYSGHPISPFDVVNKLNDQTETKYNLGSLQGSNFRMVREFLDKQTTFCHESNYNDPNLSTDDLESIKQEWIYFYGTFANTKKVAPTLSIKKYIGMFKNIDDEDIKKALKESKNYIEFFNELNELNCHTSVSTGKMRYKYRQLSNSFDEDSQQSDIQFIQNTLVSSDHPMLLDVNTSRFYVNSETSSRILKEKNEPSPPSVKTEKSEEPHQVEESEPATSSESSGPESGSDDGGENKANERMLYSQISLFDKFYLLSKKFSAEKYDHAMLAVGLKKINNQDYVAILDSNFIASDKIKCEEMLQEMKINSQDIRCGEAGLYYLSLPLVAMITETIIYVSK